ncbi:hypothetical protein B0H17DRAFT_1085032 [Mycena rosella]|uniref:Uncharacterized protein n=1 Tax=Mycena rosella TaxID=1033263 RepID=A0AAD7D390_MYCRO|nr:hypothetical protein B0H17DRAFT_1085032 [Mycena rosella]
MDAIMELPSPFIFHPGAESRHRDTLPVSPMSKVSVELDAFIETTSATLSSGVQSPETPPGDAYGLPRRLLEEHVSPLKVAKRASRF